MNYVIKHSQPSFCNILIIHNGRVLWVEFIMFVPKAAVKSDTSSVDDSNVAQSEKEEHNLSSDEEEDTVVQSSVNQRWPEDGEPVCVICGRYGAYIVDQTDRDVCSIECKDIHLSKLNKRPLVECIDDEVKSKKFKNNEQLKQLYKEVNDQFLY